MPIRLIYHRPEVGMGRLRRVLDAEFPGAVRAHAAIRRGRRGGVRAANGDLGLLVYGRPELILSVVSAETAASFEDMYSPAAESIGRVRTASTDWIMFGYYIRNNIGISFQCFAGGLFAGLGTLFFLAYNGAFSGALAGYLAARGLRRRSSRSSDAFAFELTAIVLRARPGCASATRCSRQAGCSRRPSLVRAAQDTAVLLYGVVALLVVAAAWRRSGPRRAGCRLPSSTRVAGDLLDSGVCVFTLQGRDAD